MLDSREQASKSSSYKSHLMCPASKPEHSVTSQTFHHKPHLTHTRRSSRPLAFGRMSEVFSHADVVERAASVTLERISLEGVRSVWCS